ncbi:olfactory receptor 10T2-like [Mesoplodon densirostris]|uniref:olfactory receptor 10T2-like n=1 Tax=Mesoplodon densirostris TaxID=48708 RepID=UPI0028DC7CF1|nr:olfactory receptor 10T2-like [Mesoplodon densirostris]
MAHKSGLTSPPPPPILVSESVPEKQWENATWLVTEFMLVGFSTFPGLRTTLFALFFLTYLVTLSGKVTIITMIHADRTLHTPMYRFLAVLSLSETCYTLVTIPNMLAHLLMESGAISIPRYWAQMFFFLGLGLSHCFLLTLMGYYRCVAASNAWSILLRQHPVLKLSCPGSASKALAIFFLTILVVLVSFLLILLSYTFIVAALLRMPSAASWHKAFSTCAAHLAVVIVHFGCASIIYLRPESRGNQDQDHLVAVLYTVVTLLLNPVVYTLRNKDVRVASRRTLARSRGVLKINTRPKFWP